MNWLESNIASLIRDNSPEASAEIIIGELERFVWLAKVRRMNWQEERYLGILSREVLETILDDVEERRRSRTLNPLLNNEEAIADRFDALSEDEQAFFHPYEEQLLCRR